MVRRAELGPATREIIALGLEELKPGAESVLDLGVLNLLQKGFRLATVKIYMETED